METFGAITAVMGPQVAGLGTADDAGSEVVVAVVPHRDGGRVSNKAAHIAVGVDMEGVKHVLGIRVQADEGASFWARVCAELANRGVADVLIVCCDGLTGLPEAIEATWPDSMVQTCVVHLIRSSMRFVSYQDRKKVAAALKPIHTAANEEAAGGPVRPRVLAPGGALPTRWGCGSGPGRGSSRSWRSRRHCAASSTPPTRPSR